MNDDFLPSAPPPPPGEEANDPLLRALRERLGEEFGQEPPARLWAGIRQRLPPAPAPWWRRSRRLLPLLALLLVGTVAVWQLARRQPGGTAATTKASQRQSANGQQPAGQRSLSASGQRPNGALPPKPSDAIAPATQAPAAPGSSEAAVTEATIAAASSTKQLPGTAATASSSALPSQPAASSPLARVPTHAEPAGQAAANRFAAAPTGTASQTDRIHSGPDAEALAIRSQPGREQPMRLAPTPAAVEQTMRRGHAPSRRKAAASAAALAAAAAGHSRRAVPVEGISSGQGLSATTTARLRQQRATRLSTLAAPVESAQETSRASLDQDATPAGALAMLAFWQASVRQPHLALPAPLAPADAPNGPWPVPGRRWAVQVVAGPTISYRTATRRSLSYQSAYTLTASGATADSGVVGLERPALGWGAQVQLRRVLAGRWALAAGLGYQEYATRLALDVTTYRLDSTTNRVASITTAVRQRDTYRLLTLPVQLTYQLGPRGPWQLGALGGAEPALYLGGRTTENSGCNCQQQTFTSASGSPYRSLSLTLSLGLDVRYRLGGPASRWLLLAQPTGRYVLTPFVRSDYPSYAQRQPYSLGLLLGTAWEW